MKIQESEFQCHTQDKHRVHSQKLYKHTEDKFFFFFKAS